MIVTQWSLWVRTSQFYIFNSFSCSLALQVGYGAILFRFLFCVYQLPPNHAHACVCAWHVCVACVRVLTEVCFRLCFVCLWWAVCSNLEKHHIKEYIIVIIFTTTTTVYVLLSFAFHSSSFIFPKYVIYTHSSNLSDTCKALISSTDTLAADNNWAYQESATVIQC